MIFKNILLVIAISVSFFTQGKNIIFDLGDVLLEKSKSRASCYLSKMEYLSYCFSSTTCNADLEKRYREFLAAVASKDPEPVRGRYKGDPMPHIMNERLRGTKTGKDVVEHLNTFADANPNFFLSKTEKKLFKEINDILLPENLSNVMVPVQPMAKLVEECKQLVDKNGKQKHQLFVLSNWDKESFPLIQQQHNKTLFSHFDANNIIISGHIGHIKPDPEIFDHIIKTFKLDPKECIFIDDAPENIEIAEKKGIKGIVHKNPTETREQLKKIGIFDVEKETPKTKVDDKQGAKIQQQPPKNTKAASTKK